MRKEMHDLPSTRSFYGICANNVYIHSHGEVKEDFQSEYLQKETPWEILV
jgi:hypothetical protein